MPLRIVESHPKPLKASQKVSVESSFKGFYPIPSSFDAILLEKLLQNGHGFRTFFELNSGKLTLRIVQSRPKLLKHKQKVSVEPSFKGFYRIPSELDASWFIKSLHRRDGIFRFPRDFAFGPLFNDFRSGELPGGSEVVD